MGEILTKSCFSPQSRPHRVKLCFFFFFWSIFGKIHRELVFLVKKLTISERSTEMLRKFVFLKMFEKGKSE